MSTRVEREGGGYFTCPNRWYDAGYAKQVPATITSVYMFLCRWEGLHMENESSQPIPTIARQCGCSPDVARDAVRVLEEWGVLWRTPARGPKGENVWLLKALQKIAPKTPYQPKKGRKTTPHKKNEGSEKNHGEKNEAYQPEVNQPISSLHEDSATPDISPTKRKPNIAYEIYSAFLQANNLDQDVANKNMMLRVGKELAGLGFTGEDVFQCILWIQTWGDKFKFADLNLVKRHIDRWRIESCGSESAANPPARREDYMQSEAHKASMKGWDDMLDNMIAQSNEARGDDDE